jgi:hypothetical protein
VSKAWILVGISLRLALALGLHLRNEDPTAKESSKESRLRAWWGLHAIESLVSGLTGRPPIISLNDCTVPIPNSLAVRSRLSQANPDKVSRRHSDKSPKEAQRLTKQEYYLVNHINVAIIGQKVLTSLYSPRTAAKSWEVRFSSR